MDTAVTGYLAYSGPVSQRIAGYPGKPEDRTQTPEDLAELVRAVFLKETSENRAALQNGLRWAGLYSGTIDGKWGNQTKDAFVRLFQLFDDHHVDRAYIEDFGFSDGILTRREMFNFWTAGYTCDPGSLLEPTYLCQG